MQISGLEIRIRDRFVNTKHDPISLFDTPNGYANWLTELKTRIHSSQQRAGLSVNRELILLYWQIGRDFLERQAQQSWVRR